MAFNVWILRNHSNKLCSIYFASLGTGTSGTISPLAEHDWLKWSHA